MDAIISFINGMLGKVLFFLPDSPMPKFIEFIGDIPFLNYINWFIPFDAFVSIGSLWLLCVAGYYIYSIILRWARAVE